jgi:hypothetical protein
MIRLVWGGADGDSAEGFDASHREVAERQMAPRHPEDVDLFALAIHLGWTVAPNIRDFEVCGVPVISTGRLPAQTPLVP